MVTKVKRVKQVGISKDGSIVGGFFEGDVAGVFRTFCQQVRNGGAPYAQMMVYKKHKALVNSMLATDNAVEAQMGNPAGKIHVLWREVVGFDHTVAYFYKYPYVRTLLKQLGWLSEKPFKVGQPKAKVTVLNAWVAGKMRGESDYEIGLYLKRQKFMKDPI